MVADCIVGDEPTMPARTVKKNRRTPAPICSVSMCASSWSSPVPSHAATPALPERLPPRAFSAFLRSMERGMEIKSWYARVRVRARGLLGGEDERGEEHGERSRAGHVFGTVAALFGVRLGVSLL